MYYTAGLTIAVMLYIISPVFISLITGNHKNFDQEHETIIYIIQLAKISQSALPGVSVAQSVSAFGC